MNDCTRLSLGVLAIGALALAPSIALASTDQDAIMEAVIRYGRTKNLIECILVSETSSTDYGDPSPGLQQRLKRARIPVYPASDSRCVGSSRVFWIGPVRQTDRQAEVPAGQFHASALGRPTYVLIRNWFGRWRVKAVTPVE